MTRGKFLFGKPSLGPWFAFLHLISLNWYFRKESLSRDCFPESAQSWDNGTHRSGLPAFRSATQRGCGGRGARCDAASWAWSWSLPVNLPHPGSSWQMASCEAGSTRRHSRRGRLWRRQSHLVCPLVNAQEITEGILLELLASSADTQTRHVCHTLRPATSRPHVPASGVGRQGKTWCFAICICILLDSWIAVRWPGNHLYHREMYLQCF